MDGWAKGYHGKGVEECLYDYGINPQRGLSSKEAKRRLLRFGVNRLNTKRRKNILSIIASQFQDVLVLTLLIATGISAFLGETLDAVVIAAIVALNAILGSLQEYKAEESLERLSQYVPEYVKVIRDGMERKVRKEEVTIGDIMILESGKRIAADGRLIETKSLQVEEAALTGESLPVSKDARLILPEKSTLSDRKNMVYAGTLVTRGTGAAVVTSIGMSTEMGRIARLIDTAVGQKTPLERRLDHMGRVILIVCVSISLILGVVGTLRGLPFHEMFLSSVSLAVAAIPEGLPATVTLCLALGVQRMARKGALIRKLEAIETLGSVTVICTDKTGTLTRNRMEILEVASAGDIVGTERRAGPRAASKSSLEDHFFGVLRRMSKHQEVGIIAAAVLSSDARMTSGEDPTEIAILEKARSLGLDIEELDRTFGRLAETGFTPERRMMSVKVKTKEGALICVKGASDTVIPLCKGKYHRYREETFEPGEMALWERWVEERAGRGMRILAVAVAPSPIEEYKEKDFLLLGLLAMADPLRAEAREAVDMCKGAGIRPVLVTGDHLRTAESVAREVKILNLGERGIQESDLEGLSPSNLGEKIDKTRVFARVSPSTKLAIVRALKTRGHVVAMTGDGINDAPALKEAAVGIAMGVTGTDVAIEASSMVLTDDNFVTIVRACEEGRGIYENIRKVIMYLLSCNIGEVITMAFSIVMGLPLPLSPIQLLWMNLVTDGFPALALALDPPDPGLMERPPRNPKESIFAEGLWARILKRGVFIASATIIVFLTALKKGDVSHACTVAFSLLVTLQLVSVFTLRKTGSGHVGFFSNPYLLAAVVLSWVMLFLSVQVEPFSTLFETTPLSAAEWILIFLISIVPQAARLGFSANI